MAPIIAGILTKFASIAVRSRVRDDDSIDQLNHWATVGLLLALAIGTGAKQYVGDPIHCWVPALYKKKYYQKYSDSICWIKPMYNVPMEDAIPFAPADRWFNEVSYYRWVFAVFLIQALLFKLPNIVWAQLRQYSGLNLTKIVAMVWDTSMMTQDDRDKKMKNIVIFIDRWLKTYSQYRFSAITRFRDKFSSFCFCFGKRAGNYLSGLYMFTKLLYLANNIGQFFLLSAFLDMDFWSFGADAIKKWNDKGKWQDLYRFPRIGMCDYEVRQLQNIQRISTQCVLSINLFLEKMYLILWFWLVVLLVFNVINLFSWVRHGLTPRSSENFIRKYLLFLGIDSKKETKLFVKFVHNYLRTDGIFMIRIVASNTSEILTTDLMKQLWKVFKEQHRSKDDLDNNNPANGNHPLAPHQPPSPEGHLSTPSAPSIEDLNEDDPKSKVF